MTTPPPRVQLPKSRNDRLFARWLSGAPHENSRWSALLFVACVVAGVGLGVGCGTRPIVTAPANGSGGASGTGGAHGSGGVGSGGNGLLGGAGGHSDDRAGSGGTTAPDAGFNCATVGCGQPPLCSTGCQEPCGCCPCFDGEPRGDLVCKGGCYAPVPADAAVDQMSTTLNLTATDDGQAFTVSVGTAINITLDNLGPAAGYSTNVTISSDVVTLVEVTIPGPPTPGGPARLYRLRAVSTGQALITIPYHPAPGAVAPPSNAVTINVR